MPVIIKNPFFSKKIKDATITPDKVLQGEIGYGNNNERIVGTHVCKKKYQALKITKGERISEKDSSRELMQSFNRCAHFNVSGKYDSEENVFMPIDNQFEHFDEITVLKLGKSSDNHKTSVTVIKKQNINIKNGRNVNLFIVVDGIRIDIFLGKPFDDSYRYINPISFTNKNIFNVKMGSEYLSFAYGSIDGSTSKLSFYLKIDKGIITEFGLTAENPLFDAIYALNDVEFGIEWI